MKLSNREIQEANNVLPVILARDIPANSAFRLSAIAKALDPVAESFDFARRKISKKYAQTDDEGEIRYQRNDDGDETGNFLIDPRRMDEHREEMKSLEAQKTTFNGLKRVPVEDILKYPEDEDGNVDEDAEPTIEPAVIMGLAPFLDFSGSEEWDNPRADVTVETEPLGNGAGDGEDVVDVDSLAPDAESAAV